MLIEDHGSVIQFEPEGDFEYEWLVLNTETEGWQWFGRTLFVDRRAAGDLADAVRYAGFVLDGSFASFVLEYA